jgi:cell wall-associated NlpC family hydrolase
MCEPELLLSGESAPSKGTGPEKRPQDRRCFEVRITVRASYSRVTRQISKIVRRKNREKIIGGVVAAAGLAALSTTGPMPVMAATVAKTGKPAELNETAQTGPQITAMTARAKAWEAAGKTGDTEALYEVVSGDTLSGIAAKECKGAVNDWTGIWEANRREIGPNPNIIEAGQSLKLACTDPPSLLKYGSVEVTHAGHVAHTEHVGSERSQHVSAAPSAVAVTSGPATSGGDYSCSALEGLWEEAGGSSGAAFMAAEIATAESGGNPNAESPTDDFGLWQINGSHGSMATLNPLGNARAAVSISGDGSNWGPWTTYTSGAYQGKCAGETADVQGGGTVTATLDAEVRPAAMDAHQAHLAHLARTGHATLTADVSGNGLGARLLAIAETRKGDEYVYGADGPGEFDCSGLVYWAASQMGISLPRTTYGMLDSSRLERVSTPEPGDLAFYGSGHVEIYTRPGHTFGAHDTGTVVSEIGFGGSWSPTEFMRLR